MNPLVKLSRLRPRFLIGSKKKLAVISGGNQLAQPTVPFEETRRKKDVWLFFACSTVLLLLLSPVAQRQLQDFRGLRASDIVGEDFSIYYVAAKVARQPSDRLLYYPADDGRKLSVRNLLDAVPSDTPWGKVARSAGFRDTGRFMAPPFTALLLEPLTLMRPAMALLLWRLASILMLVAATYFTCALVDGYRQRAVLFVVSVAAMLSFFPFLETLYQGQVDALVLLLWVLGVYLVKAKSPIRSALCFALATLIKASPILAIGFFLLRRQWRWLTAYALWMGAFVGAGIWQLGWQNHLFWFTRVTPVLAGGVPYFASKSLPSFILETYLHQVPLATSSLPYIPAGLYELNKAVSFMLYAGALFYFWKRDRSARHLTYELAVLPLIILLSSPESFRHHYLLAAFPILYLWGKSREWDGRWAVFHWAALGLTTLIIGTIFLDYPIVYVRHAWLDVSLSAFVPGATILLIYIACARLTPDQASSEMGTQSLAAAG